MGGQDHVSSVGGGSRQGWTLKPLGGGVGIQGQGRGYREGGVEVGGGFGEWRGGVGSGDGYKQMR